ncbi:type IV pilus assembly protein PilV [Duganella sp. 1224]|uniref:type IV pilus modification protein PilV n=1 Tax=Duganella sp. 1224 TaxID=2587052 RepID=UPI0015CB5841|nr:type IV pilus assembly protein PilV [Duganella sp. 1224]
MRARGFTLLEVLVAVVVLALGILGGVALQLAALRARHEAVRLSQATQLATGLAERIRANPSQADLYLTLDYDAFAAPASPAPAALCHGVACAPAQLALSDLQEARQQLLSHLPGGRVMICRDAGLWSGGTLRWSCAGGASAPVVVKIGWRGKRPDGARDQDAAGEFAPGVALTVGGLP